MKSFKFKLWTLALVLCMACALGLAACGEEQEQEKRFSVKTQFDATQGSVILSGEGMGSDGTYAEGASVTVTVTPNAEYIVETFTVNGAQASLSADGKYTFTVKEDTTVKATFTVKPPQTFTVTLKKQFEEEMGTASLSAPKNGEGYEKDELVTLTVTVNAGYVLESVTVGGSPVELEGGEYTFKVRENVEVAVAIRAIAYYEVTVSEFDETMGTVNVTPKPGEDGKYLEHTVITLTVKANFGHKLVSLKVDGTDAELSDEGTYSFPIEKDTQVEVTFEEGKRYTVSATFDAAMCDVTYIGTDGERTSLLNGGTFYEGETVTFTVLPVSGYELVSVTVNDSTPTMNGNGFTVTVDQDLIITVECKWTHVELDTPVGEYTLGADVWYAFTLDQPAVYEFSSDKYTAYAAVYLVEEIAEPKNATPVWRFNDDEKTNHAYQAFAAGTYVMRLSSNTGDGTVDTTLTIAYASSVLAVSFPEAYRGNWKSTDDAYTLLVGENWLLLKDKNGSTVPTTVQNADDSYSVTIDGMQYELMPYGVEGTLGFFQKDAATPQTLFLPDPLPEFVVPAALFGDYEDSEGGSDDLSLSINGIMWGEKKLVLLTELPYGKDPQEEEEPQAKEASASVYYDGETDEVYKLTAKEAGKHPVITLSNSTGTYQFTYKEEQPPMTFSSNYWGTWISGAYTLVIEEHSATLTKSGEPVEITVGTFTSSTGGRVYPSIAFEGGEYYLGVPARGSMTLSPIGEGSNSLTFRMYYTLSVDAPNATVNIVNRQESYTNGTMIHFTVTAQSGYAIKAVKVNGNDLAFDAENGDYHFQITANTVITVECIPAAAAQTSALSFSEEFLGEWKNAELYLGIERDRVTVANADGSALAHTLGKTKYQGQLYNSVTLGSTVYLFLKAEGT